MLDFLIYAIAIILVIILLIPFILGGIGMGILRHFSREMNNAKEEKKRKTTKGWGRTSSHKSSTASSPQNHQKVFADDEGTYVDFEEVK